MEFKSEPSAGKRKGAFKIVSKNKPLQIRPRNLLLSLILHIHTDYHTIKDIFLLLNYSLGLINLDEPEIFNPESYGKFKCRIHGA